MTAKRPREAAGKKPATIREIAREAGVSTATVSRVLNRPEIVSAQARERVLAAVRRHHYVSDGFAAGLASRRSRLIGLLIPTITNSIYASSTQAVQRTAQQAGYTVLVGISDFSARQEDQLVQKLLERRIEGLILTGETRSATIYDKLRRNRVPFVVTWQLTRDRSLPCVSFDNRAAAAMVVNYLVSLGHRRIGLVCGRGDVNDRALARREGFVETIAKHGLPLDQSMIFERDFEYVQGRNAMQLMLQNKRRPTAVFCANDIQAIGAIYECHENGVRVPEEISIVGFDDLPAAQYMTPQLTTVRVPATEMGRRAAEMLLGTIADERPPSRIELPVDLIVRGSTAPPRSLRRGGVTAAVPREERQA